MVEKAKYSYFPSLMAPSAIAEPPLATDPVEPPEATEEAIRRFEQDKPRSRAITDQSKPIVEWYIDTIKVRAPQMVSTGFIILVLRGC